MAYQATFTAFGEMFDEMLEQEMFIVFNENAPAELAEISALHTIAQLDRPLQAGDTVAFGDQSYRVTAVGEEANHTFQTMGHCTFVFHGGDAVELPGHVVLSGPGIPKVKPGDAFTIAQD